ncbi:hypothetical protein Rhe02_36100 [Rhizocola hellebori]|uniref:J domain-containing protein n=1 Tax=Rhizocola hellebori TaxID=1392758 RepID=A0A8J3Q985_9ACTN|nr:J domain-containing protein [Rhizocola hellebori]GIH05543.1 hypothetical protein Rhe02_36100 [Rhizocola hellebori]
MELGEAESRLVLGVDSSATRPEIRARYQILLQLFHPDRLQDAPETVREEAQRQVRQLNAAYAHLTSDSPLMPAAVDDGSTPDTTIVNPHNGPLALLRPPVRTPHTADFWQRVGLEPIIIRVYEGTGLTLCTPSLRDNDTRAQFLSDDRHLHLARSPEGLVGLVEELTEHDLLQLDAWPDLVESIHTKQIAVLPAHRYDIPAALDNLTRGTELWDPKLLTAVYDIVYELAISLDLADIYEALMPGSPLHRLYELVHELDGALLSRRRVQREVERFDLVSVYDAWTDISSIVAEHLQWH